MQCNTYSNSKTQSKSPNHHVALPRAAGFSAELILWSPDADDLGRWGPSSVPPGLADSMSSRHPPQRSASPWRLFTPGCFESCLR